MSVKLKMKISELEEISGVPRSTIHYYIREGLVHRPDKTGRTMGYCDETHVIRLKEIKNIQRNYINAKKKPYMPIPLLMGKLEEADKASKLKRSGASNGSAARQDSRARRKRELIDAALRLYSKKGFYSTNIRDIAREAGISPSAFYIYFADKRELFAEVTEFVMRSIVKDFADVLRMEKDPIKRGVRMLQMFRKNYPKFAEILGQLRVGVCMDDKWAKNRLNTIYKYFARIASAEIERLIKQGVFRNIDQELMGFFMVGMAEGAIHLATIYEKYKFEQIVIFVADIIAGGLAPRTDNRPLFDPNLVKDLLIAMDS